MCLKIYYALFVLLDFSNMYRVQYENPKEWVFVCEGCLLKVKANNSTYKYGGTWKK